MAELTIYDSEGNPIDDGTRRSKEIQDYFFAGVRFAIDAAGAIELTVFFRARESSSARSEQYYARYKSNQRRDIGRITEIIENEVERERGWQLERQEDDMAVFRALENYSSTSAVTPGDPQTRSNLETIIERGDRATVAVGGAKGAFKFIDTIWNGIDMGFRAVIADQPESSSLSKFSLAVGINNTSGLDLLGNTETQVNELEQQRKLERRRRRGEYESDDSRPLLALAGALVAIAGTIILIGIVAWQLGIGIPFLGGDGGGSGGPSDLPAELTLSESKPTATWESTMVAQNNSNESRQQYQLIIEGGVNATSNTSYQPPESVQLNIIVRNHSDTNQSVRETLPKESMNVAITNGTTYNKRILTNVSTNTTVKVTTEWEWAVQNGTNEALTAKGTYTIFGNGTVTTISGPANNILVVRPVSQSETATYSDTATPVTTDTATAMSAEPTATENRTETPTSSTMTAS